MIITSRPSERRTAPDLSQPPSWVQSFKARRKPTTSTWTPRNRRPRVVEVSPDLLPQPAVKQTVLKGFELTSTEVVYLRQRELPFRNFPPSRRGGRPMPLWMPVAKEWITTRFHQGYGRTVEAQSLMPLLSKMRPDDCLHHERWRLELVWLARGYPHFRLYWRTHLYGVVDVPVAWLKELVKSAAMRQVQSDLAPYLVLCGWTAAGTAFVVGDAKTPTNETKKELPSLW